MLTISLFDQFRAAFKGTQLASLESPRLQSMLGYLLLHRHCPQDRGRIASLFWPDTNDAQALTNLRNLLHLLRQAIPNSESYLSIDRKTVQWLPEAEISLDVDLFDRDLEQAANSLLEQPGEACRLLASAFERYTGELMRYIYADWIQPHREAYLQKYLAAGRQLLDLLDQQKQADRAIPFAEKLIAADPLNEAMCRRLMFYYSRVGNFASGVQAYLRLCEALSELEIGPSPETQSMYEQLLRHRLGAETDGYTRRQEQKLADERLERTPEWPAFQAAWQVVQSGRAHLLLVEGEAGLGKTHFVQQISVWAARNDIPCQSCQLHELDISLQFAPLIGMLRNIPPEDLDPSWKPELALWLPHLRADLEIPINVMGKTVLYETVRQALTRDQHCQVFLIDNLQWCDLGTLEWLGYVLHDAQNLPVLFVATSRPEEQSDHPTLARFLFSLYRNGRISRRELQPLSPDQSAEMAGRFLGQPITSGQIAWLQHLSGGNPLYLIEWLSIYGQALLESQHDRDSFLLPEPLRILVDERLALLGPATHKLLPQAALAGETFTLTGLLETSQLPLAAITFALDELTERRVIVETGPERYAFRYAIFRQGILQDINSAHWRLLNQQMARLNRP